MKKKVIVWLSVLTLMLFSVGCADKAAAPVETSVSLEGLTPVFMDRQTETVDLLDGVAATEIDSAGNKTDLTEGLRVVLPAEAEGDLHEIRFNACGDYQVPYYVKDRNGKVTIKNRTVKVRNIYNLYWVNATLPPLYCALDMVTNSYRSMLFCERANTFDFDTLGDRFIWAKEGFSDDNHNELIHYVAELSRDSNSYFRFFRDDVRVQLEARVFAKNRISPDRYEVKLLSDGAASYNSAFPYRENNTFEKWTQNKNRFYSVFQKNAAGEADGLQDNYLAWELKETAIIAAQRDNTELWCAYPETLTSKDPLVQAEIEKANMPKKAPDQMYRALTQEQKDRFLELVNFDKSDFDGKYFTRTGKNMIITGTNPISGNLSDDAFVSVLNKIKTDFPDYNYLFKSHPTASLPSESYLPNTFAWFTENQVEILPARLPMEVISWVYADTAMGGFDSSLYMSVPQGNVKFFISTGPDALSALTKQLYSDGVFGDPAFYWI